MKKEKDSCILLLGIPSLRCKLAIFLQSLVFIDGIMQHVFECLYWSLMCQLREKDVDIAFAQEAIDEYKVELQFLCVFGFTFST